ncbi:MAG: hypothetical protein KF812_02255 [Fimbriimonadaceae bacterium]|nr:hypothetical protein [Fimbriimonadaceae bacterium]
MGKAAWPTPAELTAFLTTLGASAPGVVLADEISAAVAGWESESGFAPFLAAGAASRSYQPVNASWLDLDGGWVSLTAVEWGTNSLTLGSDAYLEPTVPGRPGTWLRFAFRVGGDTPVVVTGVPGFAETIADDAWSAVMDLAAARVLERIHAPSTPYSYLRQGALAMRASDPEASVAFLRARADRVQQRYRRVRI